MEGSILAYSRDSKDRTVLAQAQADKSMQQNREARTRSVQMGQLILLIFFFNEDFIEVQFAYYKSPI